MLGRLTGEEQPTGFTELLRASQPDDLSDAVHRSPFAFRKEWMHLEAWAAGEKLKLSVQRAQESVDGPTLYWLVARPAGLMLG